MTLKSKFIILVSASVIMPALSLAGVYFLFRNNLSVNNPVQVVREFEGKLETLESTDDFTSLMDEYKDSFFGVLIDDSGLIYSNRVLDSDTNTPLGLKGFRHEVVLNQYLHTLNNGQEVQILFGVDLSNVDKRLMPVVFLLTSLLVLSVLSVFIIRSINKSISGLEEATSHIAQGNLDTPINTRGQDKFGSLARSLDVMRDQIKMEYDRRNRFFMGISHDLKTPLASITGYADALMEGMADDREAMNKYLGIIKNKSHQLDEGITRLIHYLKLSNYDFQANLEEKSLSLFLKSFLEVQIEDAGFHGHLLESNIEISDDLLLPFDEHLLHRALDNLVQNAYRYGSEGEKVTFGCYIEYGNIVLDIENRGQQIPVEQLEHIFEPFFRGDRSRRGDGFGLGLASVKSIVESHDWTVSVDSSVSRTRFAITIPREKFRLV